MKHLLKFELRACFRRPETYIMLIILSVSGFLIGYKQLTFNTTADILINSPYAISSMVGLLSLTSIFTTTIVAAFTLFKEADACFSQILYATPLTKSQYLITRFSPVFGIGALLLIVTIAGYMAGQIACPDKVAYGVFQLKAYLQPLILIALPNLFLCTSFVCSIGWLTKNKLMVYCAGLFLYITYMVLLMYSGSPLLAGALPKSAGAMSIAAILDPFGLSAFYEQTNPWVLEQKNRQYITLTGNLLLNRIIYLAIGIVLLMIVWKFLSLSLSIKQWKRRPTEILHKDTFRFQPVLTVTNRNYYRLLALKSRVWMDIKWILKSMPFTLIVVALVFFMSMEFYDEIDRGIRLPEKYVTTGLLANRILYDLPGILLLVSLFYTGELYWRSTESRFNMIEDSTPAGRRLSFAAAWISLSLVIFIFTLLNITNGIIFQIFYQYLYIDWEVYATLLGLIVTPLILCIGITLWVHRVIPFKWIAFSVSVLLIYLLTGKLSKSIGITHPLLRFAEPYVGKYSEMNGWDNYIAAFLWKMIFGFSIILVFHLRRPTFRIIAVLVCLASGIFIYLHYPSLAGKNKLDWQQSYEQNYRRYHQLVQPAITHVSANVELYPGDNRYSVNAVYLIQNTSNKSIDSILVNFDEEVYVDQAYLVANKEKVFFRGKKGFLLLRNALQPGDTASFHFSFNYHWNPFVGHKAFNAIVQNGSFIRLSNYFPVFGYRSDLEIYNPVERRKRRLGMPTPLEQPGHCGMDTRDFITLDLKIGTAAGQTAIGIGELRGTWSSGHRNYFSYYATSPVPFRFGISSAAYKLQRLNYKGIKVEVYYYPRHYENVQRLLTDAAGTLDYCRKNFGTYPFNTIRFAEVSQFTTGFAGTSYPGTIFMTENMIFHTNLAGDRKQDVINELAGHELSHQWWGANQLVPDDREGAKMLTETLAMYTELMMAKHTTGMQSVIDKVAMHRQIYYSERGFSQEEPLYKVNPDNTHLYYSKGLVVMYNLSELIGEERVNTALSHFLKKHIYPNPVPVTTSLLEELYKVSNPLEKQKIDSLFKMVTKI